MAEKIKSFGILCLFHDNNNTTTTTTNNNNKMLLETYILPIFEIKEKLEPNPDLSAQTDPKSIGCQAYPLLISIYM